MFEVHSALVIDVFLDCSSTIQDGKNEKLLEEVLEIISLSRLPQFKNKTDGESKKISDPSVHF